MLIPFCINLCSNNLEFAFFVRRLRFAHFYFIVFVEDFSMKKTLLVTFFCFLILFASASCNENINSGNDSDNLFKKNHTITLVVGDLTNTITVDDGEALNITFTPQEDGYIFKGWYTDSPCTVPYDFSRPVTTSFKLYAGFTLKTKIINCKDIKIKALSSAYDNDKSFSLSLVGFDYDYLEKNGMGLQFNIMYNVKYKKDYDVLFDIGYAGSPKYEVSLINNSLQGYFEEDLPTTKSEVEECYTYNTVLSFSKNKQISLIFSTDNVQNIILFSDIVIVVEAIKLR